MSLTSVKVLIRSLMEALSVKLRSYVDERAAAIESRLVALEARGTLDVEILPEIDIDRSYERGTFAVHRGGLLRASHKTRPLSESKDPYSVASFSESGWRVVMRGINAVMVGYDAENKCFECKITTTDGGDDFSHILPLPVDEGVYDGKRSYLRGDGVTHRGCFWIAQRDVSEGDNPGVSDAWRLAVKRGRDAKGA